MFPALAAFTVGIFDEGLQWLVPARVGELHDVLLNAVSIACGLIFSVGLAPVSAGHWWPDRRGRRALAVFASAVIVALAAFFHAVHLGHEIDDPQTGEFLSRYSAEELLAASRDRAVRWRSAPPRELHRTSIEDHYLAEGVWHVQRRNEVEDAQRVWHENLILEKYFAPVLDFPTYSTGAGAKWPAEQRANAEAQAGTEARAVSQHRESVSDLHLESAAVLELRDCVDRGDRATSGLKRRDRGRPLAGPTADNHQVTPTAERLEGLYKAFDHVTSATDPVHIVRRFSAPDDREIVGFCAAGARLRPRRQRVAVDRVAARGDGPASGRASCATSIPRASAIGSRRWCIGGFAAAT